MRCKYEVAKELNENKAYVTLRTRPEVNSYLQSSRIYSEILFEFKSNMAGFSSLSGSSIGDTVLPTVVAITGGVVAYLVLTSIYRKVICGGNPNLINKSIEKDTAKVAHSFDIEELPDKVAFCRCWRSKKVRKVEVLP